MSALIFIPIIPLIGVLLYGFYLFDCLIRAEYRDHHTNWESDGRPSGFFWSAVECRFTSGFFRQWLAMIWLSRTPAWIAGSPTLRLQLRRFRWCMLIWVVGGLILFAISAMITWHITG
ncbi:MAG: hypothetical protein ABIP97_11560 [Chthoniobacterales bacterium]